MKRYTLLVVFLLCLGRVAWADSWRPLAPGIEYQDLGGTLLAPWSHTHVFRIDLKQNQFDLLLARDLSRKYASIDEFSQHNQALLAINGGFFDHNYQPLGLRVSQHQQKNPLKHISWWGVFYVKNNLPFLSNPRQYPASRSIHFAIQSGPRLIIQGKIPSLKPGTAERTALGITQDKRVIVLVTNNNPMTTNALAELMRAPPLNCIDALNLDGGSSTQLRTNMDSLQLSVHGFSHVSDAIVVKPHG